MNRSWLQFKRVKMYTQLCKYALYDADGTGLCVILVNVLVNSTKFPIFCDTLYVASVAEKWPCRLNLREPLWLS